MGCPLEKSKSRTKLNKENFYSSLANSGVLSEKVPDPRSSMVSVWEANRRWFPLENILQDLPFPGKEFSASAVASFPVSRQLPLPASSGIRFRSTSSRSSSCRPWP